MKYSEQRLHPMISFSSLHLLTSRILLVVKSKPEEYTTIDCKTIPSLIVHILTQTGINYIAFVH